LPVGAERREETSVRIAGVTPESSTRESLNTYGKLCCLSQFFYVLCHFSLGLEIEFDKKKKKIDNFRMKRARNMSMINAHKKNPS
jgi:hypothetical protein